MLDRDRGKMRVRNEIARRRRLPEDPSEDHRVILRRLGNPDSGMLQPFGNLLPGFTNSKGAAEQPGIRCQPEESQRGLPGYPHFTWCTQLSFEPLASTTMLRKV